MVSLGRRSVKKEADIARTSQGNQAQMTFRRRGEIYLVDFDPTRGHAIKKTRPALNIQNDIGNRHSPITIVAAITSKLWPAPYPVEVVLQPSKANGLSLPSAIHLDQIPLHWNSPVAPFGQRFITMHRSVICGRRKEETSA
jgi:mRNA-degrading endonuclease toxin of MazEF toxin-antitoxin module